MLLRVSIDEIKNPPEKGGLGLVCIESMSSSLLLSQLLRLFKSSDSKTIAHVLYWIGDSLTDILQIPDSSSHPETIHDYYCHLESLIIAARIDDLVTPYSWARLTNRMIYMDHSKHFPVVRIQLLAGISLDYSLTWKRINSPVLTATVKDVSFLLVHNKLPVFERLFRVGITNDPYCTYCPGAIIDDTEHYFCSCVRVSRLWNQIRRILSSMVGTDLPDWQWINFFMPKTDYEQEAVWLVGNYVAKVWTETYIHNVVELKEEDFFGYLSFKYKEDQRGSRHKMKNIPEL